MINYSFGLKDVTRVRFATSPLTEVIYSIRALTRQSDPQHHSWKRTVVPLARSIDIAPLCAVIPPTGYIPDFLTPAPLSVVRDIDSELASVRATPDKAVVADIEFLEEDRNTPVAWQRTYAPIRRQLLADPAQGVMALTDRLAAYWQAAILPHWSRLDNRLRAEVVRRSTLLGEMGLGCFLSTLHDRLKWREPQLTVVTRYSYDVDLDGRGLILVPSLFADPELLMLVPPQQPTIFYPVPGVDALWLYKDLPAFPRLVALIGRLRAAILEELMAPESTTELANRLNVTPSAVSQHLTVLRDAGLVEARRAGRQVLYARTPIGDALLGAALV